MSDFIAPGQNLDTITQYILSSNTYEKKRFTFREKKDRFFNIQEKSKLPLLSEDDQFNPMQSQEQFNVLRKFPFANAKFIMRFSSLAQINQMIIEPVNKFQTIFVLDASNARINSIPEQVIALLPNLQVVNLQNNLISEIPKGLYQLELQQINLNNNLLKTFNVPQKWQIKLERLDIGKNHIRALPEELWDCRHISVIDVRNNDFEKLSFSILKIKNSLNTLGLDWVKYSPSQFLKNRTDTLTDKFLNIFWKTIEYLFQSLEFEVPNSDIEDEILKEQTYLDCYDFITTYDRFFNENNNINQTQTRNIITQLDQETSALMQESRAQIPRISISQGQNIPDYYDEQLLQEQQQFDRMRTEECADILGLNHQCQNEIGTLMHISVTNEDLGVLRSFLKTDFSLSSILDDDNHTPLSLAIQEEKYHCAKIFLNAKVNINLGGGNMGSCLNQAISKVQYFLVRDLIVSQADINKTDSQGNGPLHYLMPVFRKNPQEAIKMGYLLIEAGAQINLPNINGITPLQTAVKKSIFQAIKWAFQFNQDRGAKIFDFKIKTQKEQLNLIHLAAKSESIKIILFLIQIIPKGLFEYSVHGQRPFDIVQKNYTLSKILQAFEIQLINKKLNIHKQNIKEKNRSTSQIVEKKYCISQGDIKVNEDDDAEAKLFQGVQLMRLSPKLKRKTVLMPQENINNKIFNKIPTSELEARLSVKSSFKQSNNLECIEKYNKTLNHKHYQSQQHISGAVMNRRLFNIFSQLKEISDQADQEIQNSDVSQCLTSILMWRKIYQDLKQQQENNEQENLFKKMQNQMDTSIQKHFDKYCISSMEKNIQKLEQYIETVDFNSQMQNYQELYIYSKIRPFNIKIENLTTVSQFQLFQA